MLDMRMFVPDSSGRTRYRCAAGCNPGWRTNMTIRSRLANLEKQCPKATTPKWPDFRMRHADVPRSQSQKKMIRLLRLHVDDPRATKEQREHWLAAIPPIESALKYELEHDRIRACPQCTWPLHSPLNGIGEPQCLRCGCPVHVHGDGHVTDARPGAKSASTEKGES